MSFHEGISPFHPEDEPAGVQLVNFLEADSQTIAGLKNQVRGRKGRLSVPVHPYFSDEFIDFVPYDPAGKAYQEKRDALIQSGLRGETPLIVFEETFALPRLHQKAQLLDTGTLVYVPTYSANPTPELHPGRISDGPSDYARAWTYVAHLLQRYVQVGHVEVSGSELKVVNEEYKLDPPIPDTIRPERAMDLSQIPDQTKPAGCVGAAFSFLAQTQTSFSLSFSDTTYPYQPK